MLDILLSDTFMLGVICTVVFLLILVTVVPAITRHPQPYQSQGWRVIEPPELLTEARRITAKEVKIVRGRAQ